MLSSEKIIFHFAFALQHCLTFCTLDCKDAQHMGYSVRKQER